MASLSPNKLRHQATNAGVSVDELVKNAISEAGSIAGAARVLQVNRNTIRHHIRRLGLQVETSYTARIVEN